MRHKQTTLRNKLHSLAKQNGNNVCKMCPYGYVCDRTTHCRNNKETLC